MPLVGALVRVADAEVRGVMVAPEGTAEGTAAARLEAKQVESWAEVAAGTAAQEAPWAC